MLRYFLISYSLISTLVVPAFATETDWPKDSELSALPPYCTPKLRHTPEEAKLGETLAMHTTIATGLIRSIGITRLRANMIKIFT